MRPRDRRELEKRAHAQELAPNFNVKTTGLPYKAEQEFEVQDQGWEFETFERDDGRIEYEVTVPVAVTFWGTMKDRGAAPDAATDILRMIEEAN